MSCRSTHASSAATTFARLNCDLNDVQVLSAFHALRAETPRDTPPPSREEYHAWIAQERSLIAIHPNLSEARRASLLARLDGALKAPIVDGRTWNALRRIRPASQAQGRELSNRYAVIADRLGVPVGRVRARAAELAASVDTSRGAPPPPGYTAVSVAAFRATRLPLDRGTIHALHVLEGEAAAAAAAAQPRTEDNRRITRMAIDSAAFSEIGYDRDGGRLEVVFRTNPDRVYSYRNVPVSVWGQMQFGSAGQTWHAHIRGHREYLYPDQESAELDGFRRRCNTCGQFAASTHTCSPTQARLHSMLGGPNPSAGARAATQAAAEEEIVEALNEVTVVTESDVRAFMAQTTGTYRSEIEQIRARVDARLAADAQGQPRSIDHQARQPRRDPVTGVTTNQPSLQVLLAETAVGPVSSRIRLWGNEDEEHGGDVIYNLTGRVVYARDEDGNLTVDTSPVICGCETFARNRMCPHVRAHHTAILRLINPEAATVQDIARAQEEVQEALHSNWMASKLYASQARERLAESPVSYTDNPVAFEDAVVRGQRLAALGEDPIGYDLVNATDGMLTRESGRGFGVEIEFDLPDTMSDEDKGAALAAIARDLHAANLTEHDYQREYHAAQDDDYTDSPSGWSFEEDSTVAGEVVSPILYDEPQTWQNLAKVCEIVKAHGGIASVNTGSHVHVGTGDLNGDPATMTELVRLNNAHEDVLFRLATNPRAENGAHRPLDYCRPSPEAPLAGYTALHQATDAHEGHSVALNLRSVSGSDSDHVEFRQWDGTLDPSAIQAQVKLSAAMTLAAARIADEHGTVPRPREAIGAHFLRAKHRGDAPVGVTERDAETASARALIDTLFSREQDKAQMARLFAVTSWQSRTPGRPQWTPAAVSPEQQSHVAA